VAIIGDLHGDIRALCKILDCIEYETFLSNPYNKVIFLGDYGDRGSDSIGVLYAVCYLKQQYPNSVILMRGNHEAPTEFPFASHDLPLKIVERFGQDSGDIICKKILKLFQLLPLATIIQDNLFLVHGGLPTETRKGDYKRSIAAAADNCKNSRVLEELLWNDPRLHIKNGESWEKSRRKFGRHFGLEISSKWLLISGTRVIVRSHEPCQAFRIDHEGMVLTVFSCREAYPQFEAGYVFITREQLESVYSANDLAHYVKVINSY
jgi:protein phosphatase